MGINSTEVVSHRRFLLVRSEDVSGVSGTGVVAEGCEFHAGVALQFFGELVSYYWYPSIEMVEKIHGHEGKTKVVWLD
jgi:hypothetical protein